MKVKQIKTCNVVIIIFLLTLFMLAASCQQKPADISPAPSLPPVSVPEPGMAWSADGIISPDEYLGEMSYGDYEIYWIADELYAYIGIRAMTDGFVSVGLDPTSRMKDADMLFGFVEDDAVTALDLYSTGATGPHSPDTELGGTDDILESAGSEKGGYTTLEFKRLLSTGDTFDKEIRKGESINIIWAYGGSDSLSIHHSKRGSGEIEFR